MRERGGVAFADAEDEWTSENEEEYQGMVFAESIVGDAELVRVPRHQRGHVFFPLWKLKADGHEISFRDALVLTLEEGDDDSVLLGNSHLRMWGVGDDVYQALEDFSSMFVSVLTSYERTPVGEMSQDAIDYLRLLKSLIADRREAA